jgi:hypothetical protein
MSQVLSLSPIVYLVIGGVLLVVTVWIYHWLRVRRFSRLNAVGVEMFKSYNNMMLVRSGENVMRMLATVGLLGGCLLVGVGLFKMV